MPRSEEGEREQAEKLLTKLLTQHATLLLKMRRGKRILQNGIFRKDEKGKPKKKNVKSKVLLFGLSCKKTLGEKRKKR